MIRSFQHYCPLGEIYEYLVLDEAKQASVPEHCPKLCGGTFTEIDMTKFVAHVLNKAATEATIEKRGVL